ncbi:MAG TPA: MBOAT family O-acyltransferase [Bryobacteraceae bacterium]|nr:MBOAT family O-acyltransferase [Bryobacteraceae bacterium]
MVFSSHIFLFYFLPAVLLLNYVLPFRYLTTMLTIVSYLFYGWANPAWLLLLLSSTLVDYFCGLALVHFSGLPPDEEGDLPFLPAGEPRNRPQKIALFVSLATNLTILGFFKYYDFGVESLRALGLGENLPLLHVALPIGISFYTFQSMSYAIDVYRGEARPLRRPVDFACFVALFPHQLAGPIIRYWSIAEQIRRREFTWEKFARGASFLCLGMGKKILLANPMGHVADAVFAAAAPRWQDAWFGVTAYAFQIYFDFSAYSDMAVGLALMLGFLFTKNFHDPYRADSITDFWRRWHISLSTWLRDYLYVPLGGNRKGPARTYLNLMTVMVLGGLWHGASWTFLAWGAIHGGMLAAERAMGKQSAYARFPHPVRVALTFLVVCTGWVFFRADNLSFAWRYLHAMSGWGGDDLLLGTIIYTPYHVASFLVCCAVVWLAPQAWTFTQRLTPWRAGVCLATLVLSVLFLWTQTVNPFLYYQF